MDAAVAFLQCSLPSSLSLLKLSTKATRHEHCRDKETETIIQVDIG